MGFDWEEAYSSFCVIASRWHFHCSWRWDEVHDEFVNRVIRRIRRNDGRIWGVRWKRVVWRYDEWLWWLRIWDDERSRFCVWSYVGSGFSLRNNSDHQRFDAV